MANINVEVGELMRLSSRSEDLNNEISNTFRGINSILDNISSIVNSDTLTGANRLISDNSYYLMKKIDTNLKNIKIFLDNQISNYSVSVEDALSALNALILSINGAYGINSNNEYTSFTTKKETTNTNTTNTTTESKKNYTVSSSKEVNTNISAQNINTSAKTSSDSMNRNIDAFGTWDNVGATYDFFKEKGLTDEQIAGIMGNMYAESKFVLDAKNPSSSATGMFQWLSSRHPSDWSLNGQLEHAWSEMGTRYNGKVLTKLQECNTSGDAAVSFAKWFEGYTSDNDNRIKYANAFYDYINSRNNVNG